MRRSTVALILAFAACKPVSANDAGDPDAGVAGWLDPCDARAHDQDETGPDECPAQAELMTDLPVYRTIAFPGDEDWYRFTFPAGMATAFMFPTGATLALFDEMGNPLSVRLAGYDVALLQRHEGTIFARVTAEGRLTYGFGVNFFPYDDYPNAPELSGDLHDPVSFSGVFDNDFDQDWRRLRLTPHHQYQITLNAAATFAEVKSLQVIVPGQATVTAGPRDYGPNYLPFTATVLVEDDGEVAVGAIWTGGLPVLPSPDWQVIVNEVGADDFVDSPSRASTLAINGTMQGTIDRPDDIDCFLLPPQDPTHFYRFDATDPAILEELNGDVVTQPTVTYQGQPRTRVVEVRGEVGHRWSVQMVDVGEVIDVSGDRHSTTPVLVPVGSPYSGLFEVPNDVDAYAFDALQNHFYRLSCVASAAGTTQLEVFDSFDFSAAQGADEVLFQADRSGPLAAEFTWRSNKAFVPYQVSVDDLGPDEVSAQAARPIPTGGGSVSGAIQLSLDVDRFSVASGDPWVHVDLTSSQPLITTAVLLDGRTLVHNPDAGTGFGVRVATLDRLELRAPPGATFPVSYSMAARPSADDYDEATPVPIPIGTAVYGHLDAFDDIDVLSFDLAASVTNFRVHIAPGCAFFDLVTPTGARLPIFDGHLFTYGPGTYLLRIHTERCGEGNWGVTVTVP